MDHATFRATIDQIERDEADNELAVLIFDDTQQLIIPMNRLPEDSREGTVLNVTFQVDSAETDRRRDHAQSLQSRLFGSRQKRSTSDTRET